MTPSATLCGVRILTPVNVSARSVGKGLGPSTVQCGPGLVSFFSFQYLTSLRRFLHRRPDAAMMDGLVLDRNNKSNSTSILRT